MLHRVVVEETIRRHVTHAGYLTYLALLAIVSLGISRFDSPGAAWPSMVPRRLAASDVVANEVISSSSSFSFFMTFSPGSNGRSRIRAGSAGESGEPSPVRERGEAVSP